MMEKEQISKRQFIVYLINAFGFGWLMQIIVSIYANNNGNQNIFGVFLMLTMYMPFLGTLVAGIPLKSMGWVPHLKGRIRYILFSLWMPALLSIIGGVLFFVIFPDAFDPKFTTILSLLEQAGALEQLEAQGITIPKYLLITSIQAITYAPFLNMTNI